MHHKYHTEAVVLAARAHGEGDRVLTLYTKDLGLLPAYAKSLRTERSKLRYGLQLFAHAHVDLLEGRSGWRITSAQPITSHTDVWRHKAKREIVAQYMRLLTRFIQGEEEHAALFSDLLSALIYLGSLEEGDDLRMAELLMIVRALELLGYWGDKEKWDLLFSTTAWSVDTLSYVKAHKRELLALVNDAIRTSQL